MALRRHESSRSAAWSSVGRAPERIRGRRRLNAPGVLQRGWAGATALLTAALLAGCATYSDKLEDVHDRLDSGDLDGALGKLSRVLKVKGKDEEPKRYRSETSLGILERATILQAMGRYKDSERWFQRADRQLELLDLKNDAAGKIGQFVFSDSAKTYQTTPVEKLALNAMNLANYLAEGDLEGARVEAKRYTVMHQYLRDYEPGRHHLAFGSYLAGFTHERLGERDAAIRYYDEALAAGELRNLGPRIEALRATGSGVVAPSTLASGADEVPLFAARTSVPPTARGLLAAPPTSTDGGAAQASAAPSRADGSAEERDGGFATGDAPPSSEAAPSAQGPGQAPGSDLRDAGTTSSPVQAGSESPALDAPATPDAGKPAFTAPSRATELLIVAKVGRVPYKVPRRMPIGAAIGLAGIYITGDPTILAYTALKVVTYPELVDPPPGFTGARVFVDGQEVGVDLVSDIASEVAAEWDKLLPMVVGAAITRLITRAAVAEGARAAGSQAKDGGAVIGMLAALAAEGALLAADKPDTRSWTTLPAAVHIARAEVEPGDHRVEVYLEGGSGGWVRREVRVAAGGFAFIDVTTLR